MEGKVKAWKGREREGRKSCRMEEEKKEKVEKWKGK